MTGVLIYFKIAFIFGSILSLGIWWLLFIKNRSSLRNRIFGLASLMTAIWSIGFFVLTNANSLTIANLSRWFMESGSIFIPALWYHFIFTHLNLNKEHFKRIRLMYIISSFIWVLNLLDLFIPGLFASGMDQKLFFPYYPSAGLGYYLFFIHFAFSAIYTVFYLHRYLKKESGIQKEQIRFILLAAYFGLGGGGMTFLVTFGIEVPPFGIFFFAFYPLVIAYAIVKYRLMNIRLVLTRSILYGVLVAAVASFFALSIVWTGNLIGGNTQTSKTVIYIVDAVLVVIFLDPLKRILAKLTDKIFYKGRIDYQVVLQEAGNIVAREIDLDDLLKKAIGLLSDKLKIQKISVLTPSNKHFKLIASSENKLNDLKISENFIDYLSDHRDFVIVEELMRNLDNFKQENLEYKVLDKFIKEAEKLSVEMVIPVIEKNKLTAIFLFSAKQSGDLYGQDDINFFKVLIPQIATAIEKAKLYEEVQELNVELQAKVEDRTKSLQKANLTLEDRNKFLTTMQVVTNMVSRTLDLKKIYQMIADSIASELGYVGGVLSFIDDEKQILQVGAITNNKLTQQAFQLLSKKPHHYESQLKEDFNFSAKTAVTGKIIFSDKMSDFLSPPVDKDTIAKIQKLLKVKTAVGVPVFSEARIIGVIQFFLPVSRDKITSMDIEMMNALTNQVGIVSRNLKLYENLQGTNLELQEANLRLRELDQAKSEFLSIASHQLRTPISAIKGYLSMMLDGDFGVLPHNFRKIMKDLFESSSRLARLINIFLNVSRIESGRLKLEKHPIQIGDMIDSVIQELSAQASQKKLKLSYKKSRKKIPMIFADSDKLREVVLNLIDNSIKYTLKGSVTASVESDKEKLTFLVTDTGIGIDPGEVKGLFRKFVRGSGVAQIHTGGSGLGIFIAQKIIKEHGGKIWAESEGKEKGSIFKFTLPLYDEKRDGVEEEKK
jgi:signal transduction histidine kinase